MDITLTDSAPLHTFLSACAPLSKGPRRQDVLVQSLADAAIAATVSSGETTATTRIPAAENKGDVDAVAVPFDRLRAIVDKASGRGPTRIWTKPDATHADVSCGKSKWRIPLGPIEDAPSPATVPEGDRSEMGRTLIDDASIVAFAASKDAGRYAMNCVEVSVTDGRSAVVATDGKRLAVIERDVTGPDFRAPIDGNIVKLIASLRGKDQDIAMVAGDRTTTFDLGSVVVATATVSGDFPPWREVVPDVSGFASISVSRDAALDMLSQLSAIYSGIASAMILRGNGEELVATFRDPASGEGEARAPAEGPEFEDVGLNPDYLREGIAPCGEDVTMAVRDGRSAVVIESDGFRYVLMPIQIV